MSGACPAPMPDLIVPKNKNKSKNYFASQNTPYIPSPEGRGFTAFFGNMNVVTKVITFMVLFLDFFP